MKRRPWPRRAEVLQLLQLLAHPRGLQRLVEEGLVLLEEERKRPEQVHTGRSQGDPGDSGSA